jgi:DNA gyrase subunit A
MRDESSTRRRPHRHRPEARRDPRESCSTSSGATLGRSRAVPGFNMLAIRGGKPRTAQPEATLIEAFVRIPRSRSSRAARSFELARGARPRAHLARPGRSRSPISIRSRSASSAARPDPPRRANRLLMRDWPIAEIAPYIRTGWRSGAKRSDGDTYRLSDVQVRAILDLRLHRLTALGRDEILATS